MARVRSYKIDKGSYYEDKRDGNATISFTIYDTDDDMHMYYGLFEFDDKGYVDISWDDVETDEEMIPMDINYYENYEEDDCIFDKILKESGIDMRKYN